jgi:hypothetical protein
MAQGLGFDPRSEFLTGTDRCNIPVAHCEFFASHTYIRIYGIACSFFECMLSGLFIFHLFTEGNRPVTQASAGATRNLDSVSAASRRPASP